MSRAITLTILLAAAVLEAGGDAIVRTGLRAAAPASKALWFALGAIVLFAYGYVVNTPSWDFGRLLGIYVVLFFLVAQVISWVVFHQPPGVPAMVGGALIIAGGVVMAFGAR